MPETQNTKPDWNDGRSIKDRVEELRPVINNIQVPHVTRVTVVDVTKIALVLIALAVLAIADEVVTRYRRQAVK